MTSARVLRWGMACAVALSTTTVAAQNGTEQLDRGGYAAIVWNASDCAVTIVGGDAPVPARADRTLRLAPMPLEAGLIPKREPRVDDRVVAYIAGDAHLEVQVRESCDVTAWALRKSELIANTETRIRHLEFRQSEARGGKWLGVAFAAAAFGAAAHFAGESGSAARTKTGLSLGAGLAFLGIVLFEDTFGPENRESLALHRRLLAELRGGT